MTLDLSPARWIWLPSQRTLANTFVLFRKTLHLSAAPASARGWIFADSRYRLTVNGRRVQFGPAPCDPRWQEADTLDLRDYLQPGENVIAVEVLYYGHGDGTWPTGKPGLLLNLQLTDPQGNTTAVLSDASWRCAVDRGHRPGQFKRWYLRALQEDFDTRLHPAGWRDKGFDDAHWLPAAELRGSAGKPSICTSYPDYATDSSAAAAQQCELRARDIAPIAEHLVPAGALAASNSYTWHRNPDDWFEFRIPGCFEVGKSGIHRDLSTGGWQLPAATGNTSVGAIFVFATQHVGWPVVEIDAPAGAIVELLPQESHDLAAPPWLDTHFFAWSRFVCSEGRNLLEPFDFECLRWLQVHVRNASRPVIIRSVALRARRYDWPAQAQITLHDQPLQRLMDASVQTLHNAAQEICADGMGRERQQYSGDVGHQLQAIRYTFGETRQPARYLRTWSQGLTHDGYFMDCWPAFDRLNRIAQRQMGLTPWGPILDHGIGFTFDCSQHYLETADLAALQEPYPRLRRFATYLSGLRGKDGLLPVENLGVPSVWIDHDAYTQQRHKQCALNLYFAASLSHALAPLAKAMGDDGAELQQLAGDILAATVKAFWCSQRQLFVVNLPWLAQEKQPRLCDRSLATAVLFAQCPGGNVAAAADALAACPPNMGLSYPANAGWRLRALAKLGRDDVVVQELRQRWATLRSVTENGTLSEHWRPQPDTVQEWSHCPVAPLYILFADLLGLTPATPGFQRFELRPRLMHMPDFELTAHTPPGAFRCTLETRDNVRTLSVTPPPGAEGTLYLPQRSQPLTGGAATAVTLSPA